MAHKAGGRLDYNVADLHEIARQMSSGKPPACIEFKLDGKFHRVIKRSWNEHQTTGT
jgi:hypothetical protein